MEADLGERSVKNERVSVAGLAVLEALKTRADSKGSVSCHDADLAEDAKLSVGTVKRARRELTDLGLLKVVRQGVGRGMANHYRICQIPAVPSSSGVSIGPAGAHDGHSREKILRGPGVGKIGPSSVAWSGKDERQRTGQNAGLATASSHENSLNGPRPSQPDSYKTLNASDPIKGFEHEISGRQASSETQSGIEVLTPLEGSLPSGSPISKISNETSDDRTDGVLVRLEYVSDPNRADVEAEVGFQVFCHQIPTRGGKRRARTLFLGLVRGELVLPSQSRSSHRTISISPVPVSDIIRRIKRDLRIQGSRPAMPELDPLAWLSAPDWIDHRYEGGSIFGNDGMPHWEIVAQCFARIFAIYPATYAHLNTKGREYLKFRTMVRFALAAGGFFLSGSGANVRRGAPISMEDFIISAQRRRSDFDARGLTPRQIPNFGEWLIERIFDSCTRGDIEG
jgi:hypothetical protein